MAFDEDVGTKASHPVFRYKTPFFNLHGPQVPGTPAMKRFVIVAAS